MKNPLISVIMPVYNPGRYFRAAVDSVLAQTLTDFELLLIDDGSTDGSGAVCDEYAAKDARIRVRHGRNGGICASRNVGLSLASGEWLAFCDHDDVVEAQWLAQMHDAACKSNVDVVKCNHSWDDRADDGTVLTANPAARHPTCEWTLDDLRGDAGYRLYDLLGSLIWDGLYRHEFWRANNFRFDERFKYGGEDCYLDVDIVRAAGRGVWLTDVLYHHYFNLGVSTASRFHPEMVGVQREIAQHEKDVLGFSTPPELLAMFKRWAWHLRLFVFDVAGCDFSFVRKVRLFRELYDAIVGPSTCFCLRQITSYRLRVLAALLRLRLFAVVLLAANAWRRAKKMIGR